MTLGKALAVAGIWVGAGIMTIAISFGGINEVAEQHRGIVLAAPAIAAGVVTFFAPLFEALGG